MTFRVHTGDPELDEALWAGDVDRLCELAPCICCCAEHTFEHCLARLWSGCRGGDSSPRAEREAWLKHYQDHHGFTEEQFYGWDTAC